MNMAFWVSSWFNIFSLNTIDARKKNISKISDKIKRRDGILLSLKKRVWREKKKPRDVNKIKEWIGEKKRKGRKNLKRKVILL